MGFYFQETELKADIIFGDQEKSDLLAIIYNRNLNEGSIFDFIF